MKYRAASFVILILFSGLAVSQQQFTDTSAGADKHGQATAHDKPAKLDIEYVGKSKVSEALIQRIFRETLHEVAWQLNPQHPPHIQAKVMLRLGAPGFTVETIEGKERHTILCMKEWDEYVFARMVARAARNGLFSDQELDRYARAGLARARAVTSVRELQHH